MEVPITVIHTRTIYAVGLKFAVGKELFWSDSCLFVSTFTLSSKLCKSGAAVSISAKHKLAFVGCPGWYNLNPIVLNHMLKPFFILGAPRWRSARVKPAQELSGYSRRSLEGTGMRWDIKCWRTTSPTGKVALNSVIVVYRLLVHSHWFEDQVTPSRTRLHTAY